MPAEKMVEWTDGNHIYMKMFIGGRIEEIDVYHQPNGDRLYKTTADGTRKRKAIIEAFNTLY